MKQSWLRPRRFLEPVGSKGYCLWKYIGSRIYDRNKCKWEGELYYIYNYKSNSIINNLYFYYQFPVFSILFSIIFTQYI